MVTIYDVASKAGVGPATVSRVINGGKNVKKSTMEKVMQVIEETGYVPNTLARGLSKGSSNNIAFVVPDIDNQFFITLLHGISDMARECDSNVFMFDTSEKVEWEHRVLDSLSSEMIKGLIIIPAVEEDRQTRDKLLSFDGRGVPVVLIDRDVVGQSFDGVFSEDRNGSAEAVECLIAEGHRKIAIITGPLTSRPGRERLEGYKNALLDNGIEINDEYIVNGAFRVSESYNAMEKLMQAKDKPTAIFASNNLTTLGCLKYMKEHNLSICKDISLVGFDDIPELTYTDVSLTVVTRPVYDMGRNAMHLLSLRLLNENTEGLDRDIVRRHQVKTKLISRGSEKHVNMKV